MKELLYAKYNSTRRRGFQTSVKIYKTDEGKIVEKQALCKKAEQHLMNMDANCKKYSDMYNNISMLDMELKGNVISSRYIEGESLSDLILKDADSEDSVIDKVKKFGKTILDVNHKYVSEFEVTDGFVQLFGDIKGIETYEGNAFTVSNIDSAFDNFIMSDGRIYSFDNEWLFDVLIPQKFILFRAVKMFYLKCLINSKRKQKNDNIREFIYKCGIDYEEQDIFEEMDEAFQCYVHGENRRAIYTDNYMKDVITLDAMEAESSLDKRRMEHMDMRINDLEKMNRDLENIIAQKDSVIDDMSETVSIYRKELRNPFYALYRLSRKVAYNILPHNALRTLQILKNEGISACYYRVKHKLETNSEYEKWIVAKEKEEKDADNVEKFEYTPLISVVVPVYNVSEKLLTECIESVVNQSYGNWQLCMADDCSTMPEVKNVLKRYENNPKIDIVYREKNGHISRATNSALEMAKGEFIALLDCDDLLTENALYEVVKRLNENRELDYIYSDEDKIDENSKNRHMPHFKPDWSPDTLMSNMYTCHLSVYRKSIVDKAGGFRAGYEGAQDYDLCLRVTEIIPASHISHISKILYHWREIESSTASDTSAKPYILEAAFKSKSDAVERRGLKAGIELIDTIYQYRVNYIPQGNKKVSIVIPSKDNVDMLSRCVESICRLTKYKNYEIIIVDNGSNDRNKADYDSLCVKYNCRYIYEPAPFNFSGMCNTGADNASGEYLLFLNDDIEILDGEWLERMLGQAQLDYAGAVGAKLLYPNSGLIQHIGVINILNGPTHALAGLSDEIIHYFGRNVLDYNYLAVTAACLMIDREKFKKAGGFDESFAVAYNDIDLCMRLVEAGYYNVVRNDVIMYHYESYSRGDDTVDEEKMKRLETERNRLYERHPLYAPGEYMDPYYNRFLAQTQNDFSYNYDLQCLSLNGYHIRKPSDYSESGRVVVNIDSLSVGSAIKVNGWGYVKGSMAKNFKKARILVFDNDTVYEFDTNKVYRPDVSANPEHKRMAMTGFNCESADCLDKNKKYKVAVSYGRKIKYIY